MEFGGLLTAWVTPSLLFLPSPTPPLKVLPASLPYALSDAAIRYFWKLSVVPDSSLRKITMISSDGSCLPGLRSAISGAFQFLTVPLKILASVGPSSKRSGDPAPVDG